MAGDERASNTDAFLRAFSGDNAMDSQAKSFSADGLENGLLQEPISIESKPFLRYVEET